MHRDASLTQIESRISLLMAGFGFDIDFCSTLHTTTKSFMLKLVPLAQRQAGSSFSLDSPKDVSRLLYGHLKLSPDPSRKVKPGSLPSADGAHMRMCVPTPAFRFCCFACSMAVP